MAGPARPRRARGGRWGTVTAVSAVAACLVSALTACGGGGDGGYTAVGAAGGAPSTSARPTASVTLFPLDGAKGAVDGAKGADGPTAPAGGPTPAAGTTTTAISPSRTTSSPGSSSHRDGAQPPRSDPTAAGSPRPGTPSATPSPAPAALTWSTPTRAATDKRWCEKVTVTFANSGGTAVRSGTVTLGTHIVDLLGIDWSTVTSTEPVPAPVAPGATKAGTWTVCVDDWRVPLGMHVETRVVSVDWS
ncbi:MAG: hypothetical protein JF597_37115 [Streptomyces sp.]|uniref:hypothetical protein n=1 Tax=Streptomyces sp. TaxID=1931 RepID=UPI0025FB280E|nr:hypothetical protein [Streptomyces sp.]MBW8798991.1 hypothetical protein [Streptomyces sp.]